ncbi:hypothetical protein PVAND_008713 [Polypedilum vanderplanki]|uniref:Uncharacterized protein n=1 Tax=Polypedilum vanderplanki TaxID=319348 RepID=A0A9J6CAF9_POLVA|nr:hypothetical protein PVAND_008713 [Polypedilum vanderplanki]
MKFSILFAIFLIFQGIEISNSFTINCNYRTNSLPIIGSVYECYTTNIPTSSGITVTNVNGTHLSGKNNNDVISVWISGNWTLPFVPRNFNIFFPNVKAIRISSTTIETLFGDEFDEFPQLEVLELYQSNLTTISSKLFEKTPKMVYVYFGENMIERVGHDLFTPLNVTQLQRVYFYNNRCIHRSVTNTTAIISLINELREKCPFDDEFSSTSTTTSLTTTEDFVCDLKDSMNEIQENLMKKDEKIEELENKLLELQAQIQIKDQKIENVVSKMKWLKEEMLRLTTHPCACK